MLVDSSSLPSLVVTFSYVDSGQVNTAGFVHHPQTYDALVRTMPKDIQSVLRHSRLATTTDVYMQEIPESVKATVEAINKELRLRPQAAKAS